MLKTFITFFWFTLNTVDQVLKPHLKISSFPFNQVGGLSRAIPFEASGSSGEFGWCKRWDFLMYSQSRALTGRTAVNEMSARSMCRSSFYPRDVPQPGVLYTGICHFRLLLRISRIDLSKHTSSHLNNELKLSLDWIAICWTGKENFSLITIKSGLQLVMPYILDKRLKSLSID